MIGSLTMSKNYQIIDSKEIENRLKISEFKFVATSVQLLDICQLPNCLYVCDSGNNRIGIFTSKLEFIKNNLITFRPFEIKIINNVACVRSFNTFDQQLHFYNLPNFTIQSTYKDFHQPISVIQNSFYQFDPQNELLYCYDSNGIQIDQISSTGVRNLIQSNSDG